MGKGTTVTGTVSREEATLTPEQGLERHRVVTQVEDIQNTGNSSEVKKTHAVCSCYICLMYNSKPFFLIFKKNKEFILKAMGIFLKAMF